MSLHSSLLFVADVLISLEIWEILLHWPDTGSHLSQRLIVVTFSIFRSEVECCYNWTLLFDVVQPGTFKCARTRYKTCPLIRNVEKISGPKRSIKITDHFTCSSANVIYCITCTFCKNLYIDETGRRLGDRFREHASKPVAGTLISTIILSNIWQSATFPHVKEAPEAAKL